MNVLQEILEWSQGHPMWQRDALRRLALNGELSDEDINSLTEICKGAHGLAEQQATDPLAKEHMPDRTAGAVPVSLVSIFAFLAYHMLTMSFVYFNIWQITRASRS